MTRCRSVALLVMLVCAVVAGTTPAHAILNGELDGDRHPYVGLVYTDRLFCSSAAISPTVVLTADHCIEGTDTMFVTFDNDPRPRESDGWPSPAAADTIGRPVSVGDFCGRLDDYTCDPGLVGFFGSSDVALLVLDDPVSLPRYARLPDVDQVEGLAAGQPLTAVGYGGDAIRRGGGQPELMASIMRRTAPAALISTGGSLDDVTVRARIGDKPGRSGTCSGDSGSPLLLGDTILGVLSGGVGGGCAGPAFYSRIDTPQMLGGIRSFLS